MDHELMTGWLSVDPMADKYPHISPYNYCMWNPVKLVDPDGMDGRVVVKQANGRTLISISTTVYLRSNILKSSQLSKFAKEAEFRAKVLLRSRYFEDYNCEVSFNVQYKVYHGEELQAGDNVLDFNPDNTEKSGVKGSKETINGLVCRRLAGTEGDINSDICNYIGAERGKGLLHETLHFLGLSDRYSDNHSFKGFENDIMGLNARNATIFDDSHYLPYIEKYKQMDMSDQPYILLKETIDLFQTQDLQRKDALGISF